MRVYIYIIIMLLSLINLSYAKTLKIGIIQPLEHQAISIITNGFKSELQKLHPKDQFEFVVKNAQADANLLRSISKMFIQNNYDVLVPIGTQASQILVSLNDANIPVIALAAKPDSIKCTKCNVVVINDEIGPEHTLMLTKTISDDPNITLVYSNNEKSVDEAKEALDYADKNNLIVKKVMVNTMQELYTVSKLIRTKNIVIFKDNVIASNIQAIVKQLKDQVLVTSDEGSVQKGACLGIGVNESDIGIVGAKNLSFDNKLEQPKIVTLSDIKVFYNKHHCKVQKFDIKRIETAARKLNMKMVEVK